jgi:hypothetical protein
VPRHGSTGYRGRMLGGSHSLGHEEANSECLGMGVQWYSMAPA